MIRKKDKSFNQRATIKGEIVPEKDEFDEEPTGRYINNNAYKTPPNNLTTKRKSR